MSNFSRITLSAILILFGLFYLSEPGLAKDKSKKVSGEPFVSIQKVEVLPDPFSPNNDGIKDITTFQITVLVRPTDSLKIDRDADPDSKPDLYIDWEIAVADLIILNGMEPVPSLSIPDPQNPWHFIEIIISAVWDGIDQRGLLIGDGVYPFKVNASLIKIIKTGKEVLRGRVEPISGTITLDTTAPIVTDLSPANRSTINAFSVIVTGFLSDLTPVAVTVNRIPAMVMDNNRFLSNLINLIEGLNFLTVVAEDQAGNVSKKGIAVTFPGKKLLLNLHFAKDNITLKSFSILDGKVQKIRRVLPGLIKYEIFSTSDVLLAESGFGDPRIMFLDMEDLEKPGDITGGMEIRDDFDFLLIVPFPRETDRIKFSKTDMAGGKVELGEIKIQTGD